VRRIVGAFEVEDDRSRHCPVRLEEQVDQQAIDGGVVADRR
jgi:hypothetical protein